MSDKIYEAAIVGGGSAGVMAALRGVLNNDDVLLITGSPKTKKASRAQWVAKVENIPGYQDYNKGIMNPNKETLDWIKESKFADRLETVADKVTSIEKDGEVFTVETEKGDSYKAYNVVLATGVMDVQPHINGSIKDVLPYANVQLIDYCLRCDGHHVQDKSLAVIGSGDGAAWVGIMLHERYNIPQTTILTNGEDNEFSEEVQELVDMYGFKVETSPITDIKGNAKEVVLEGFELEDGTFVGAGMSFVSLGMIVYNELAKQIGAELDRRGFVITNAKSESSVEGVYAVGDLQADKKKQIYTGWDTAVDALDHINGKKRKRERTKKLEEYRRR